MIKHKVNIKKKLKMTDLPKTTKPLILIGDVIEELKRLPEKCVDVIITSPPYFGQRDYKTKGQIGQEQEVEEYVKKLVEVGKELNRVLKDSGSYFLNIGDKYVNRKLQMVPEKVAIGLQNNGWVLRNTIIWYKPNHMPSSIKNRLSNVWEPIYFFVKDTGKYYSNEYYVNLDKIRLPHKTNGDENGKVDFPDILSEKDYFIGNWENKINEYNEKLKKKYKGKFTGEKINLGQSPGARKSLGISYSKQRVHKILTEQELEIIKYLKGKRTNEKVSAKEIDNIFGYKDTAGHWFRLDNGRSLPKPEDWSKLKKILKLDDRYDKIMTKQHYVLQTIKHHKNGKNPGDLWIIPQEQEFNDFEDVWKISLEKVKDEHFAVFPTALPYKIIKSFCPENGIVLDPFAGSGTTGKAARILNKKSILIDINQEYKSIIEKRCDISTSKLSDF